MLLAEGDLAQVRRPPARVLKREEAAQHGRVLPERLQRELLVPEGVQGHLADLRDQRGEGHRGVEPHPQRERVEEGADQPLELGAGARAHGRADQQLALSGHAVQQDGVRGEGEVEQRGPAAHRRLPQPLRLRGRQEQPLVA